MAIAWALRDPRVTSALMGASSWSQIREALEAVENVGFSIDELDEIDRYAVDGEINLWAASSEPS
jgi:L-glyceraldehyde 3-phosphate reductase